METFGERLRIVRNLKDITLDKLAEDLQTTKATLSRYENNLREPKVDFVRKVAEYFNVNPDYLVGLSDEMTTNENIMPPKPITPKDKTEELREFLTKVGYTQKLDELTDEQIKYIIATIELYLKSTNNYK